MRMAEVGVPEPLSTTYWSVLKKTAPNPLAPIYEEALAQNTPVCRMAASSGWVPSAELPALSLIPAPAHPQRYWCHMRRY
jgi:hypothetical protein